MTSSHDASVAPILRVHVLREPEPESRALLESLVDPNVVLTYGDELLPPGPQLLVAGRPDQRYLDAAPELHTLVIPWAGLPVTTGELMRRHPDIAVHNIHHNAGSAAELAFALALAAAKRLIPGDRALRTGDWTPRYTGGGIVRLDGGRALILGYGAIGRRLAAYCRAFGMDVTGVGSDSAPEAVDAMLAESDVVFVALPLTAATKGFLNARRLALLPAGAILVNVGRGAVVDEEALYRALEGGTLGAAGLDVWYNYPLDEASRASTFPSRFDFGALDNVVLSPHRGGAPGTARTERERMEAVAASINAAARGDEIPHRVDLEAGY